MHKSDPAKRAAQTLIIKALFKTCTAYAALNKTELDWASTQNECSTLTMQSHCVALVVYGFSIVQFNLEYIR